MSVVLLLTFDAQLFATPAIHLACSQFQLMNAFHAHTQLQVISDKGRVDDKKKVEREAEQKRNVFFLMIFN